jgi:hypothetical protein
MAGEDRLMEMFDAWREDIDSVPFPQFSVVSTAIRVPRMREPLPAEVDHGHRGQGTHADA